jgi:ABC-type nitrate/sulfonate/bicarbonate transport system substrate-binding protein
MIINRRMFATGVAGVIAAQITGTEKSRAQGRPVPLRMQASWLNDAEFIGYYAALDKEFAYYNKMEIDLEYISGGPAVIPETSLLSGKADVALTTPETTAQYILRDKVDLRIIGAQYQKSPIGVVSLAAKGIRAPADLKGKRLAVAPVNRLVVDAMFKLNSINPNDVTLVPYTYDPRLLISGAADASVDFTTNLPYALRQLGAEPTSFLLYDFGLTLYNDTIVVTKKTLDEKFDALVRWMAASIQGWQENYRNQDFQRLPTRFASSWFKDNGRTVENEIDFNKNQFPLIATPAGIFAMNETSINANIAALDVLGLKIPMDIFDNRVAEAARAKLRG